MVSQPGNAIVKDAVMKLKHDLIEYKKSWI